MWHLDPVGTEERLYSRCGYGQFPPLSCLRSVCSTTTKGVQWAILRGPIYPNRQETGC